jgi:hypothetical protein
VQVPSSAISPVTNAMRVIEWVVAYNPPNPLVTDADKIISALTAMIG